MGAKGVGDGGIGSERRHSAIDQLLPSRQRDIQRRRLGIADRSACWPERNKRPRPMLRRQRLKEFWQLAVMIAIADRDHIVGLVRPSSKGVGDLSGPKKIVLAPGIGKSLMAPVEQRPHVGVIQAIAAAHIEPRPQHPQRLEDILKVICGAHAVV